MTEPDSSLRGSLQPTLLTLCDNRIILSGSSAGRSAVGEDGPSYLPGLDAAPALAALAEWLENEGLSTPSLAIYISALLAHAQRKPAVPARGQLASWQQRKALAMLGEHLSEPVSIEAVAAACRLSRAHFTRAFGASVGISPYRWRMERRLALARQLLADTDRPFPEVARACGFSKMSHFSHTFTQVVGTCPRRWRQSFGHRGSAS